MEESGTSTNYSCTCGFQFGVNPLSSQDSQTLNLTEELSNLSINFHGPAGENQRILAKEKIEEIKQKVADYYYDPECKVIAIPNHFVTPKKPTVLGKEGRVKQDDQFRDKYLEEKLHHEFVNAARKLDMEAFIMNNFQAGDCIQQIVNKGKDTRGKDQTSDFNEHEMRLKKLLNIEDIPREKLDLCIEEHLKWKENKLELKDSKSWLFKKVLKGQKGGKNNKIEITPLYKISTNNLEKFYTYQYLNYSLQETKTEWDSLIIIPKYSAIINIEVKLGPKDSGDKFKLLKNASDQTKQHFSFMQKLFGGMLTKNWVFVRAACVPYLTILEETTIPCVNCQQFILQDVKDVTPWLKQISELKLVASDNNDQTVYKNLVAELIYHISIKESSRFNQLISDPLTISRETVKALTGKTTGILVDSDIPINMLNNEQLQAVHSPAKFLIIDGDYGTGKTYVLKERAKKCATDNCNQQIFYINLTAITHAFMELHIAESSVMDITATLDFDCDHYSNIRVVTIKDLVISRKKKQKIVDAINIFLRDNYCDHLFIDEMIPGKCVYPEFIETICVNLKVDDGEATYKRREWIETFKVNHNAVYIHLTKNMRNSQQIINLANKVFNYADSTCSPDTNVIGNHNFYYNNIYDIDNSLLVVAAVNKYFKHKPKESVVVLANETTEMFEFLNKKLYLTIPVVRDFKEYMEKPEGILVTSIFEFQGAQARNIIICYDNIMDLRNSILRTMSHAIIILKKGSNYLKSTEAIEIKNLHKFIYHDGKAPVCHHYHNEYKHNISALTMAILDKYKLLDRDESIAIITCPRISKDIIREANAKEFLSLPKEEREILVKKKIKLENRELYEDVKRNISRNYADISWSYYDINYNSRKLKDLVNKPKHINYINIHYFKFVKNSANLGEFKNIIVYADKNIHKNEFAAWGDNWTLNYSDDETSIRVERCKEEKNEYDIFCRNIIMLSQPKFAIVVHDDDFDMFSSPKGALNLIEDDDLHEFINPKDIYPEEKAPLFYHYHNEYKHNISALTMAILDKYKLLDQDESIGIITYSRISKGIIREAITEEFLSSPEYYRMKQVRKKIEVENKELFEDVKRNISSNYADITWSYNDLKTKKELKDLINKPRHINYINICYFPKDEDFNEIKNIILFADRNIDHKHEFAAWGYKRSLYFFDDKRSIYPIVSERCENDYVKHCRNLIMSNQPKFTIVVHDGNLDIETFCLPKGALNLMEDDNLHEHIPVTNTEQSNQ